VLGTGAVLGTMGASPDDISGEQGSAELQEIVDSIFCYDELLDLSLSVTVADPSQADCPLIACSTGFTELTGYSVNEIVGRNCRFLLNGVPQDFIDEETRIKCRQYVVESKDPGVLDRAAANEEHIAEFLKKKPWASLAKGEIICVQTNCTKSGELFKNMFYMKQVQLNDNAFILGLQARLPEEWETCVDTDELEQYCQQAFVRLGRNMCAVEQVLSKQFWYSAQVRRQDGIKTVLPNAVRPLPFLGIGAILMIRRDPMWVLNKLMFPSLEKDIDDMADGAWLRNFSEPSSEDVEDPDGKFAVQTTCTTAHSTSLEAARWSPQGWRAPKELHEAFDALQVMPYESERFELIRKIEDANRNQGCVCLMKDLQGRQGNEFVAAKQMPNSWIRTSQDAFLDAHPGESEHPWNDIGCNSFLQSIGYPYSVGLVGVYRDAEQTSVVSDFVTGGDLFGWATDICEAPGIAREQFVRPLAKQMARAIQQLHELSIVHRDLSVENVLLSGEAATRVKIIDFGAAVTTRHFKNSVTGKASYQAPELFGNEDCDGFLCDSFALGVILYAISLLDYPWMCTQGRGDKCFQYVALKGFKSFAKKRRLPNSKQTVDDALSPDLLQLLEGLLEIDPAKRLTLGEPVYGDTRRSIWDEPWMR